MARKPSEHDPLNCKLCGKPKVVMLTKKRATFAGCPCQGKAVTGKPAPLPPQPEPVPAPAPVLNVEPPKRRRFGFFGRAA